VWSFVAFGLEAYHPCDFSGSIIFKMCIQREPNNWSQDMYKKYTETISVHLKTKVLPKLQEAKESNYRPGFLKVWADRWSKENLVVQGLAKLFMYLVRSLLRS
jgi:hypothetical protein